MNRQDWNFAYPYIFLHLDISFYQCLSFKSVQTVICNVEIYRTHCLIVCNRGYTMHYWTWMNYGALLHSLCQRQTIQEIPAFRDFTIRDPLYFVIQFQASILWIPLHFMILKKKSKKTIFFRIFFGKISDFQLFWIVFCLYTVIAITWTLRIPS